MLDLNLEGKRAVVTGASLGIGEAVVKMLSDHGASVHFVPGIKTPLILYQNTSLKIQAPQLKVLLPICRMGNLPKIL